MNHIFVPVAAIERPCWGLERFRAAMRVLNAECFGSPSRESSEENGNYRNCKKQKHDSGFQDATASIGREMEDTLDEVHSNPPDSRTARQKVGEGLRHNDSEETNLSLRNLTAAIDIVKS